MEITCGREAPDFGQNFNRYSYTLNNPLRFTDPNGEFWHIVIGAATFGVGLAAMDVADAGITILGAPKSSQIFNAQVAAIDEGQRAPMPASGNVDDVLMERIGNRQVNSYLSGEPEEHIFLMKFFN